MTACLWCPCASKPSSISAVITCLWCDRITSYINTSKPWRWKKLPDLIACLWCPCTSKPPSISAVFKCSMWLANTSKPQRSKTLAQTWPYKLSRCRLHGTVVLNERSTRNWQQQLKTTPEKSSGWRWPVRNWPGNSSLASNNKESRVLTPRKATIETGIQQLEEKRARNKRPGDGGMVKSAGATEEWADDDKDKGILLLTEKRRKKQGICGHTPPKESQNMRMSVNDLVLSSCCLIWWWWWWWWWSRTCAAPGEQS